MSYFNFLKLVCFVLLKKQDVFPSSQESLLEIAFTPESTALWEDEAGVGTGVQHMKSPAYILPLLRVPSNPPSLLQALLYTVLCLSLFLDQSLALQGLTFKVVTFRS